MSLMENPWAELVSPRSSYILNIDRECVQRHNERCAYRVKIIEGSIPEPFIGNPDFATVVLLGLNPGHSADDEENHRDPTFRDSMLLNLQHKLEKYPFYPLNPEFSKTGAGRWWLKRTRQLREESRLDLETLAKRLMVIEWFPYHSAKFAKPKQLCHSQSYSFHLAKAMQEKGALVVRMRSKSLWEKVDPQFGGEKSLKNPQSGYVTRGNMTDKLFGQILKALREGAQMPELA